LRSEFGVDLDLLRLHDGDTVGKGRAFHRGRVQFHAAAGGAVRLGYNESDVVARDEGLERWHGELGRSTED